MLSTRIRGKIMPTRDKPQKINMRVTTSQYEKRGKNNAHLLSRNLPAGEKKFEWDLTAEPSNLTPLYYNGSAAKSHSTTTQYRQLRRLRVTVKREWAIFKP